MAERTNPRAEEYRRKAAEAEEMAKTVRDYEASRAYLDIARQWREMADYAERSRW
jgi:hypothetical protein